VGKKQITERAARVHQNPVTHETEVTVLDDVQKAFERCVQCIDGQMLKLSAADNERLARRLIERVRQMIRSDAV
jgi:prophage DNA circulation protein